MFFFFFFLVIVNSSTPSSGYILPALPVINSYTNLITLARVILHQQNQVIHKNLYCCCYCVVYTLPSLSPPPPLFSNLDEFEDREKKKKKPENLLDKKYRHPDGILSIRHTGFYFICYDC